MTGCSVVYSQIGKALDEKKRAPELEQLYYKHAAEYLPKVIDADLAWSRFPNASSDMANVSQIIPVASMTMKIGREGLPGHSGEWRICAGTKEAEEALLTAIAISYDTICDYVNSQKGST